jgi:hypothetical protein
MTKIGRIQLAVMEQTRAAVLVALRPGPRMIADIAEEVGCSYNTVKLRLDELLAGSKVSRTLRTRASCGGNHYLWHLPSISAEQAARMPRIAARTEAEVAQQAPTASRAEPFAALFGSTPEAASFSPSTVAGMHSLSVDSAPAGSVDVATRRSGAVSWVKEQVSEC